MRLEGASHTDPSCWNRWAEALIWVLEFGWAYGSGGKSER